MFGCWLVVLLQCKLWTRLCVFLQGTFVKFQPQSVDFLEISNPRAVLETTMRHFSCLTEGDVICLPYNDRVGALFWFFGLSCVVRCLIFSFAVDFLFLGISCVLRCLVFFRGTIIYAPSSLDGQRFGVDPRPWAWFVG